jgi:hypothetical protein
MLYDAKALNRRRLLPSFALFARLAKIVFGGRQSCLDFLGWRVWPSRYLHWPGDGSARGMNPAPAPPAQGVLSTEARIRSARDARAPDLRPCEHVADYFAYQ